MSILQIDSFNEKMFRSLLSRSLSLYEYKQIAKNSLECYLQHCCQKQLCIEQFPLLSSQRTNIWRNRNAAAEL